MKGVSISSLTRLVLLVLYVILQIPCVLVPLFFGKVFLPANHAYNKYVRSSLSPLSTGVYLLFFSIRLAVQTVEFPRPNPGKRRMLLMTHSSTLDFMVVTTGVWLVHQAVGGAVCIVKKELLSVPFIGWLQVATGSVPVARSGDVEAAKRNLAIAEDRLKENYVLAGFPEGSRRRSASCGPEHLLPFKKGMFHIAHNVGKVEFIPLVMIGGNSAWPSNYLLPIPGSKVVVRIGDVIPCGDGETVEETTGRVRKCMQVEIEKTGAMDAKNNSIEYSVDKAFEKSKEVNLWRVYGFEALLMPLPMIITCALLFSGRLA